MTIRERIDRNAVANRQARQEYVQRLYQTGYKPPVERDMAWDAARLLAWLIAALCALALGVKWGLA